MNGLSLRIFFFACLLFWSFFSCEEEVAELSADSDPETYYPLALNQPAFYQVDSIILRATVSGIAYDTTRNEARETLLEIFLAPDGTEQFRGERWERRDTSEPWRFKQSFTLNRTSATAVRREDNLAFTQLTFPVRAGKRWNPTADFDVTRQFPVGGEQLDIYNGWSARYEETPSDTLLVRLASEDNLIDLRQAYERYAPGVGLVERFVDARHTQCRDCCNGDTVECSDLPWDEKAEKGYIIRQVRIGG